MIRLFLSFFIVLAFSISSMSATYKAVVTKITDGDTVWVKADHKKVKLRLLGIDTPEKYYSLERGSGFHTMVQYIRHWAF